MTPRPTCPRCARAVPLDAPGAQCLSCLLGLGLEPPLPRPFGRYELLRKIGSGGMGIIYEARELNPDRLVALKMIRSGELATAEEREWFRREAQQASRLEHRNIVAIFHVGGADEPAYYTMRLMTGGTLAEQRSSLLRDPRRAARLVAAVARAVHHGHARGVLHRDLKPANILLDEEGNPHVADFGIATRLDDCDTSPALLGTPHYMSPEQAGPPPRQLTMKSDVYSLGAILFELLTGHLPSELTSARSLVPKIDRDLEAICLTCLSKNAEDRFSAEELAEDLERFLRGDRVAARQLRAPERTWRWARQHPAAAGFAATAALTVLTLVIAALSLARILERDRREDVLQANAFAARSLAGLISLELAQSVQAVERLAADPRVISRLEEPPGAFPAAIEEVRSQESFVTIALLDTAGMAIARSPLPPDSAYFEKDWWGWTDHFVEARRRGELGRHQGYVGLASRSAVTGEDKFTISAPVFAADGGWQGVIYGSFSTDSVLGRQRLPDDPRLTTALLGRPDRTDAGEPLPTGFVTVVHEGLQRGKSFPVSNKVLEALPLPDREVPQLELPEAGPTLTDDAYRDPVPGFEGRWLAGLAPVGNTAYVFVVQTRASASEDVTNDRLVWLLEWAGLPLLLGSLVINLLLFFFRRRSVP